MAFVFPDPPDEYDPMYIRDMLQRIENIVSDLESRNFVQKGWTITTANMTTARTVTASAVTASGVRDQFETLIHDLIKKGYLSGES